MNKTLKKFTALLLSFCLVFSLSYTNTFADTIVQEDTAVIKTELENEEEILLEETIPTNQSEEILSDTSVPAKQDDEILDSEKLESNMSKTESEEIKTDMSETEDSEIMMEEESYSTKNASATSANYLTFTAEEENSSVTFAWEDGENVQYSLDKQVWNTYEAHTVITLAEIGDSVSFKGENVKTGSTYHFKMTGKIGASGSVTSLTDGFGGDPNVVLSDSCYKSMFENCYRLTSAPELPATNLAPHCYERMFESCGITSAPDLPATNLTPYCYKRMFEGCRISSAPELPATNLAPYCYERMFESCNITSAPELPAMTLAESCYKEMFNYCTNLTSAPALPATTLAPSCYAYMFSHCEGLTSVSFLPATTLAESCYSGMYLCCYYLTSAPSLPATTLAKYCYSRMFEECDSLKVAPSLPATTLAEGCYIGMFNSCINLTSPPFLPATTLVRDCYEEMFLSCKKLVIKAEKTSVFNTPWSISIPGANPDDDYLRYEKYMNWMFDGCPNVEGDPARQVNTTFYIEAPPVEPTGITLNKSSLYLPLGQTASLTANVLPANAANKAVTWTSSNKAVATVSSSGLVTGVKRGTAKITAMTFNGKTATCTVTVGFRDISNTAWYYSSVNWAVNKGITSGVGDGTTFAPEEKCTRAQVVTFLWNAAGRPSVTGVTNPFTDVKKTDWFYAPVLWAVSKGITKGTTATTFSPNNKCTRAQVVTFLWNWTGQPKTSNTVSFRDVPTSAYFYSAVKWAVFAKVTNGVGDGTAFAPNDECSRAQVVTFLYNYYKGK